MNRHEGKPRVQLVGKVHQVFRVVEQGQNEHPEEADEDGHLHDERAEAADGVDPALPVQGHGLLGDALAVAGVAFLYLAHLGLEAGHRAHLAQLPHGERDGQHSHQHGESDDGQAHLRKAEHVQHQQGVEHGPDDDFVPEQNEYGEKFHWYELVSLPGGRRTPQHGVFSWVS